MLNGHDKTKKYIYKDDEEKKINSKQVKQNMRKRKKTDRIRPYASPNVRLSIGDTSNISSKENFLVLELRLYYHHYDLQIFKK